MAASDYAILVGISHYRDEKKFPPLKGPSNDVARFREWLLSPQGGDIPEGQVTALTSPDPAMPGQWVPNRELFAQRFNEIALDRNTGEFVRREGRLYLYFSGHGFSRLTDDNTRAALYGADNLGKYQSNLAGTLYAEAAKRARLFREVVLIMDCCRDTESNVDYSAPDLNLFEHANTEGVQMFSIYAAPKRGKAQERELPGSGGLFVGLMTNALLRALQEAPCDIVGRVPGRVLTQYIGMNWVDWYPQSTPPSPRVIGPDSEDMFFRSGQRLEIQCFVLPKVGSGGFALRLRSASLNAEGVVREKDIVWRDANLAWQLTLKVDTLADGARVFELALPAQEHELQSDISQRKFVPGAQHVIEI
ncbi:caspase family protein [Pseudomonas fakonensis]|uniref:Caspase family protein n=1 Tax=Pseudomonas fakonensis TaxID=2842355 RepID=A0ABX8N1L9_9PSED|nr:caspase family protein [Pseudomonas fakonensis]QXH49832.1 caspase family protein [Pseudomonas fakonensis]